MKYWINETPRNDKLVIWDSDNLYKANPKEHKLRDFRYSLEQNEIPEGLFSIYKSQIKRIEMDESKKYICVYFGADSYEHIRVTDIGIKKEIFSELSKIENTSINVKELTLAEKTKVQRRAFIVLTIFFIIGFLFSIMIETGSLPDGRYPAIILFLGGFGILNVILFYLTIVLMLGLKYYLVSKVKRIIHTIDFN